MKYFGEGLSEKHKKLNKIIRKAGNVEVAKSLFLDLHTSLHQSAVSNGQKNEVDDLLNDLDPKEYAIMPTSKDETIAWVLWHISRIEDLTMGILVASEDQIFNEDWKLKMNAPIIDTGNALSDAEIMSLSKSIKIEELLCYRNEVGKRTRQIVTSLSQKDIIRPIAEGDIQRIQKEGGVTSQEDSVWLLDFWSKKDVAGILLMPPTRHVMLHLNDCCKWKEHIRSHKKNYMEA